MSPKERAKLLLDRLSRYRLLRALIPILGFHSRRNDSQEAFAKYHQKLNGLQRMMLFWRYAPPKYRGGLLLNLFGYQIFRYFYLNLRFKLRLHPPVRVLPKNYFRDICRDGYLIWPGALSLADSQALLDFAERYHAHKMNHFEDFSELVIANSHGPVKDNKDYRKIYELIKKASHWDEFGPSLTGRKFAISPYVAILHYKSRVASHVQYDGQDTPHTDVCYPSFKAFFYLNDVDAGSGPLTYYRGSQAVGVNRAWQEYVDSIRYFSGAKNDIKPVSSQEYAERHGFSKDLLMGSRGTGIIFNVQGVHRRGDFLKDRDRERKVLLIDFRQVESRVPRFAA